MLPDEIIDEGAIAMMRRVLNAECARRSIKLDSPQGEELALLILDAFRRGMTEERITQLLRTGDA
ncbi:hypothetical protein JNB71_13010 [Rhizobium herbae]|uniref:Uncharacterized protein n=1 Tax=Rhizobium herbae TaxID=508661 RepID=A0ABS7HAU8_9HYPH|nr:hypothetical protein [Rhizobium herbae]MBW9064240.1 hypothetical protein [Rhizobium herbae]